MDIFKKATPPGVKINKATGKPKKERMKAQLCFSIRKRHLINVVAKINT
mgnify:CR=1 FL=1|tara:strand:+ start:20578 stop:20724 length:147 start_codon:yes stop_codon:yes gene_type:complete